VSIHSPDLPTLIVNRSFMREFVAAQQPCCALGMIDVENRHCAFIAIRPHIAIPAYIREKGFAFGNGLIGTQDFEVVQFIFNFYGYQTYNVLLNPNNPIVQSVLQAMIESGDYFILTLVDSSGSVTAFRSDIGTEVLANLTQNWQRILQSQTTDSQYLQAAVHFVKNPKPEGQLLQWVCSDNISYLDLTHDRLELYPA
jgi:hypothetical protein